MKYVLYVLSVFSLFVAFLALLVGLLGEGTFVFLLISGVAVTNALLSYIAARLECRV